MAGRSRSCTPTALITEQLLFTPWMVAHAPKARPARRGRLPMSWSTTAFDPEFELVNDQVVPINTLRSFYTVGKKNLPFRYRPRLSPRRAHRAASTSA